MLEDYLIGKRKKEKRIVDLCALALETVGHDDVLISISKVKPTSCIKCGRSYDAKPLAFRSKGHTDVVLVCDRCEIDEEVDISCYLMTLADVDKIDTCFLWRDAMKLTNLLTNDLRSRVISDAKSQNAKS